MSLVRKILVKDGNGDSITLYEVTQRRFLRTVRRLKLDSGELVKPVGDQFIVVATGETLVPIDDG